MAHQTASKLAQQMAKTVNTSRLLESKAEAVAYESVTPNETFFGVFGGKVALKRHAAGVECPYGNGCKAWVNSGEATVHVELDFSLNPHLLIHELFHIFDNRIDGAGWQAVASAQKTISGFPNRPDLSNQSEQRWGFAGGNFSNWQKSRSGLPGEEFADMGIGWTYEQWQLNVTRSGWSPTGQARADLMANKMTLWIDMATRK
jgi:hypothetical protein